MADRVLNVLMVDDSQTQYMMVVDFLQVANTQAIEYQIEWASTYEEGVRLIDSKSYDVCLIDYELGNANGLDFIAYAVKQKYQIPMILLTGHGNYTVDLKAMEAGAVDYLDKTTLKPNTLERTIRYATENQRMLEQERHQRVIAEALLDTAIALNSTLEFDDVLERILINMQNVIPHDSANILLLEDGKGTVVRYHGYEPADVTNLIDIIERKVLHMPTFKQMLQSRQPLLINDILEANNWTTLNLARERRSYLGIPIIIQDEVIGFLNFDGNESDMFNQEHVHYAQIFAQQAGQAIRNTRAFQQAQILAATQERQRLARDLHDAVSQTLFSASVIAQTLPRFLENNPDEVRSGLDELNRLNRGALAEMRTLLVELRPQALIEMDLPTLIRNLVHAFNSRSQTKVESRINYTASLPEDVHIAFYRIAQEALNNIQKYADATQVTIDLLQQNSHLELRIADNGCGFDPSEIPAGHMGLTIMKERAVAIGGDLSVTSKIGQGTVIELIWYMKKEHTNDEE